MHSFVVTLSIPSFIHLALVVLLDEKMYVAYLLLSNGMTFDLISLRNKMCTPYHFHMRHTCLL